jgi:hypothetical protein
MITVFYVSFKDDIGIKKKKIKKEKIKQPEFELAITAMKEDDLVDIIKNKQESYRRREEALELLKRFIPLKNNYYPTLRRELEKDREVIKKKKWLG